MNRASLGRLFRYVSGGRLPIPVTITCGLDEENLENNRAVAAALTEQGYDVELHEVPGGHDWPVWRRALKARLPDLLERAWST